MKRKPVIIAIVVIALIVVVEGVVAYRQRSHNITLTNTDTLVKAEEIRPLSTTLKVRGTENTGVVFTNVETGRKYEIEDLTPDAKKELRLEHGQWYTVEAHGTITVGPVEVRIS